MGRVGTGRRIAMAGILIAAAGAPALAALDLFDWMATASTVVAGRSVDAEGRRPEIVATRVLRGTIGDGQHLRVDLAEANAQREEGVAPLKLEADVEYLFVLEPSSRRAGDVPATFRLVRGVASVREVPAEGRDGFLEAAAKLVAIQDRKDEVQTWTSFRDLLDETHPLLLETALEHFLKFRRGEPAMAPSVRPILSHPRPDLRRRAAALLGQILARPDAAGAPELQGVYPELFGLARRDVSVEVRVAATAALAAGGEDARAVLDEIATSDPEQAVRYEARRILFERRSPREAAPAGGPEGPRAR